jgi:hypothetical protein
VVTTFGAGETIHFFNAPLKGNAGLSTFEYADECLRNGDIKLSLTFRSVGKSAGKVIGIDKRGMDEFLLKAKSNTHALTSFVHMNMVSLFLGSPFCKTMTPEQVLNCMQDGGSVELMRMPFCVFYPLQANIFGPLLKIRLAHTGREVGAHIPPTAMKADTPQNKPVDSSGADGHIIMVLHGGLLSIPSNQNTTAIVNQLISQELPQGKSTSSALAK